MMDSKKYGSFIIIFVGLFVVLPQQQQSTRTATAFQHPIRRRQDSQGHQQQHVLTTSTRRTELRGFSFHSKGRKFTKNYNNTTGTTDATTKIDGFKVLDKKHVSPPSSSSSSPWANLKKAVYTAADGVQKGMGGTDFDGNGSGNGKRGAKKESTIVSGGYHSLESKVLYSSSSTPGQRLMEEFQTRSASASTTPHAGAGTSATKTKSKQTTTTLHKPFASQSHERLQTDPDNSHIMINNKNNNNNSWKSIKKRIYGTVDATSTMFQKQKDNPIVKKSITQPISYKHHHHHHHHEQHHHQSSTNTFKPLVQSTLAREKDIQNALKDLDSDNPIKQQVAQWTIEDYDKQKERLQRKIDRELAAKQFKQNMYQVGDSILWGAEQLVKAPKTVSETVDKTTKNVKEVVHFATITVPTKVNQTVATIQSIHTKVHETTQNVQSTVETTVETAQRVAQNVQAIPTEVNKKVKETRETYEEVKENIDETTTNLKVFLGMEKPTPKPPKVPPPPPKSFHEVGLDIASGAAKGAGKAAWWVTTNSAKAALHAAKSTIYSSTTESKESQEQPKEAMKLSDEVARVEAVIETSIPYDAAAKLAYESSDKSMSYDDFKIKYEADAVADVIAKQRKSKVIAPLAKEAILETSIPYDAAAKLAYESSDTSMSYDDFKVKYEADAVADVIAKQRKSKVIAPLAKEAILETSIPYDAAAKLAYESSEKSMSYDDFKAKYETDAVADFIAKQPKKPEVTAPPSKESVVDTSIPYDAAAKLAYESSDKSMSYDDFRVKYEADAVADVIAKQPKPTPPAKEAAGETYIPYDAAAKLAYESSEKSMPYGDFKVKYEADAVADVIAKQPKSEVIAALSQQAVASKKVAVKKKVKKKKTIKKKAIQVDAVVETSILYDAAAKLAYESSDKSMSYDDFKVKYEADAVADVIAKQYDDFKVKYEADAVANVIGKQPKKTEVTVPQAKEGAVDTSIPYDAAAKLAYESSDKSMSYDDFKIKYEADAVADVIAKQPKKPEVIATPSQQAVASKTNRKTAKKKAVKKKVKKKKTIKKKTIQVEAVVETSIPYDATAKLAYESSDKSMSYDDFKIKYETDAVADVIAKQLKKTEVIATPSQQAVASKPKKKTAKKAVKKKVKKKKTIKKKAIQVEAVVETSIPYDAAAKLAYESSDKSMSYDNFKIKYETDAVADVIAKQPKKTEVTSPQAKEGAVYTSIPYDAAARLAYESSDKSMSYDDFKVKYEAGAVADVIAKQPKKTEVIATPSQQAVASKPKRKTAKKKTAQRKVKRTIKKKVIKLVATATAATQVPKAAGLQQTEPNKIKSAKKAKRGTKKSVSRKRGVPESDWSKLSTSTLKRKTVKDLTGYLTNQGKTFTDENGETLKKDLLVEAITA